MQCMFLMRSLRSLLSIAGLLFLSSIYSSCNQPVVSGKTSSSLKETGVATVDTVSEIMEATKKPGEVGRSLAINSPKDAIDIFDDAKARYMELVKVVKDSTAANSQVVPYVYIQKLEKVKQDLGPVMTYFSRNRNNFSKAQIRHILNGTDEMGKAMSEIPLPQ